MDIIQRDNRFFLQLSNGEMELTEQQARKRVERGDKLRASHSAAESRKAPMPETESSIGSQPSTKYASQPMVQNGFSFRPEKQVPSLPPIADVPETLASPSVHIPLMSPDGPGLNGHLQANPGFSQSQSILSSGKYFDNLIKEFEQIYEFSEDKEEAEEKLIRFCRNAITKLHHDRRNPKSDHVIIDFYILSWTRVLSHIRTLRLAEAARAVDVEEAAALGAPAPARNIVYQVLLVQLMQADGLMPISDVLQGVSHQDIVNMISGLVDASVEAVEDAMAQCTSILLKRNITADNIKERIALLRQASEHFEKLPYFNIISRVKLLVKIYEEMAGDYFDAAF